jgi:hypothetical protein
MENISNISSEEELLELRNEGKVSEAEFQDLLAAIRKSPAVDATDAVNEGKFINLQEVPWQIWVVVALLVLEGVGNLLIIPQQTMALIWLGAKCLLILGLLKRWRWIFCLYVVIGGIHVMFFLLQAPLVALINLVMVVLVLCSYRFYFPGRAENNDLSDTKQKLAEGAANTAAEVGDKASLKHKSGKIAFYLMLVGIVLPILSFFICSAITAGGEMDVIFSVCFFACVLVEIPAFVFGVISWPDVLGKAAIASISAIVVFALLFVS